MRVSSLRVCMMGVIMAALSSSASAVLTGGGIPDASNTDLQLWLDADDSGTLTFGTGSGVLRWDDKSTYGRDFESNSGTDTNWVHSANHEPTSGLNTLNSRNTLYFAQNDFLQTSIANALPGGAGRTMYFVYRPYTPTINFNIVMDSHDSTAKSGFWYAVADLEGDPDGTWFQAGDGTSTWPKAYFSSDRNDAQHSAGVARLGSVITDPSYSDDGGTRLYADGKPLVNESGSGNTAGMSIAQASTPLTIGDFWDNIGSGNFNGDIAEILVYDRALTPDEHNDVGYYLQQKWGISGQYVPQFGQDAHSWVTSVEMVADNAALTENGAGNNWGGHQRRIVRTDEGVFTAYIVNTLDGDNKEWRLARLDGSQWEVIATGTAGREPVNLLAGPDGTLHIAGFPDNTATLWSGKPDAQGHVTMTSQTIPGMPNTTHPYAGAGIDASGNLTVVASGGNDPGYLYTASYDVQADQWTSHTSQTDFRNCYSHVLPDGTELSVVATRDVTWQTLYDAGELLGIPPGNQGHDYCFNEWTNYEAEIGQDLQAGASVEVTQNSPNDFVHSFVLDAYKDSQDRTHVIYWKQLGNPPMNGKTPYHALIDPNGSLVGEYALPNDSDGCYQYEVFEDGQGRLWLLDNRENLWPVNSDGHTLGTAVNLGIGSENGLWSIATPGAGTSLENTIDLTLLANDSKIIHVQVQIDGTVPGDTDSDGDVDNVDFGVLFGNFTGPDIGGGTNDPNRANLIYDAATGNVVLDSDSSGATGDIITSYAIEDAEEGLIPGEVNFFPFFSSTDEATTSQISQADLTMQGFSGTWDIGDIFPTGMSLAQLVAFVDLASYSGDLGSGYNDLDLLICSSPQTPLGTDMGDFDEDGDVDNVDFGTLYGNYTGPLAGGMDFQVTPEPATVALLAIGGVALLRRRERRERRRE